VVLLIVSVPEAMLSVSPEFMVKAVLMVMLPLAETVPPVPVKFTVAKEEAAEMDWAAVPLNSTVLPVTVIVVAGV